MTNTDAVLRYTDLDGSAAYGVVWSPGPLPNTIWVLDEPGSSRAVPVRVPVKPGEVYRRVEWDLQEFVLKRHGQWLVRSSPEVWEGYLQVTRVSLAHAPKLPAKLWHAALASSEQLELVA